MKLKFLLIMLLLSAAVVYGQEIELKAAVTTSAGGSCQLNSLNISKWRIGQVHTITLKSVELTDIAEPTWGIKPYPNPFESDLSLRFKTEEEGDFIIQVFDIKGQKQWFIDERKILPNEVLSIDLSFLPNALYFLSVMPKNKSVQRVVKIHKQ